MQNKSKLSDRNSASTLNISKNVPQQFINPQADFLAKYPDSNYYYKDNHNNNQYNQYHDRIINDNKNLNNVIFKSGIEDNRFSNNAIPQERKFFQSKENDFDIDHKPKRATWKNHNQTSGTVMDLINSHNDKIKGIIHENNRKTSGEKPRLPNEKEGPFLDKMVNGSNLNESAFRYYAEKQGYHPPLINHLNGQRNVKASEYFVARGSRNPVTRTPSNGFTTSQPDKRQYNIPIHRFNSEINNGSTFGSFVPPSTPAENDRWGVDKNKSVTLILNNGQHKSLNNMHSKAEHSPINRSNLDSENKTLNNNKDIDLLSKTSSNNTNNKKFSHPANLLIRKKTAPIPNKHNNHQINDFNLSNNDKTIEVNKVDIKRDESSSIIKMIDETNKTNIELLNDNNPLQQINGVKEVENVESKLPMMEISSKVKALEPKANSIVKKPLCSPSFLKGRKKVVIVITGASKGLGLAITKKLCEIFVPLSCDKNDPEGDNNDKVEQMYYEFILTSRSDDDTFVRELQDGVDYMLEDNSMRGAKSPKIKMNYHQLDLADGTSIQNLKNFIHKKYGGLDILINNAAICMENSLLSHSNKQNNVRRSYRRGSLKPSLSNSDNSSPLDQSDKLSNDLCNGNSEDENTQHIEYLESNPSDYDIAFKTLRVNFWGVNQLCSVLFPLFSKNGRIVNITCSAGTARNHKDSLMQQKMLNTVNNTNLETTNQVSMENAKSKNTDKEKQSWFASSYFNLEFIDKNKNKAKNSESILASDKTHSEQNSKLMFNTLEELSQLMEAYLESTKNCRRSKEGWGGTHYSVSKMALTILTALQQRFVDKNFEFKNLVINSCCPGYIRTSLNGNKGYLQVEKGCETPVYLALLENEEKESMIPRGKFVYQMKIKTWN
ncbi:putative uncharacterized protein DDB_G0282133 isoform X2 [Gordionus sp. m RMFG-2023]|uniref:putative uncharacterized protein DDB_G0282133 isoform X2 n=1 Tax=Gordionus sp. m RMFG-2023 TaxID=3053472 RepID=UPI0031FE2E08